MATALIGVSAVGASGVLAKIAPGIAATPTGDHEANEDGPSNDAGVNHEFESTHDGDFVDETGEL